MLRDWMPHRFLRFWAEISLRPGAFAPGCPGEIVLGGNPGWIPWGNEVPCTNGNGLVTMTFPAEILMVPKEVNLEGWRVE